MRSGENNCARVRMTGAQVEQEILNRLRCRIYVEDEKVGFDPEDKLLGLGQTAGQFDQRLGGSFLKRMPGASSPLTNARIWAIAKWFLPPAYSE
jgi:hypothetical protein